MDRISEDLDGLARLNTRMLDGCEYAYEALAAEWAKSIRRDHPTLVSTARLDERERYCVEH